MPKVQDLFKSPDGSDVLDVKIPMRIITLPNSPVEEKTAKGTTITVFPVSMEFQGAEFEWKLNQAQMERIFTRTKKNTGEVLWKAREGDIVNVWYASPKGQGRAYYIAEAATGTQDAGTEPDMAAEVAQVFNEGVMTGTSTASVQVKAKPKFFKAPAKEETKWDGTPRQNSFRQGLAGMEQAILSNPNVNPLDPAHVLAAREVAEQEVRYVRSRAPQLEQEISE